MKDEKDQIAKAESKRSSDPDDRNLENTMSEDLQDPLVAPKTPLPEDLAAAYSKLLAEKNELYDRLLRKQAELENLRKRTQREKDEFRQIAAEDLIRALLPTVDAFERALKQRNP